ncbi:helix-turn-helix domain-containing protein [Rahnella inusitata]|uniref:helix-turn-helix domain-containing protein n=1 Tax=Rahnella inusitata TaxID=58169 RepID=UPI001BC8323A|nr:helix-turn-helix domain-containing protein [Rahnella inusitata]QUT17094.1 helix-turn-helix domain-containing protein [Rahnella inusitata]
MSESKPNASEVLERLSSSYGVTTQKELAACLEIPAGNVSAWMQRGSVPGNAIIKCALDTGADLNWLVSGGFANANKKNNDIIGFSPSSTAPSLKGSDLIRKMLSTGGRPVLKRIMDAYGFKTQKELSEYFEVSTGTISTWVRREFFPADLVIASALDTGVCLSWVATGEAKNSPSALSQSILKKELNSGVLEDAGHWNSDLSFLSHIFIEPVLIANRICSWLVDFGIKDISNGRWLLDINSKHDIYDVVLLPAKKLRVKSNNIQFMCDYNDVTVCGKVVVTFENNL